MKKIFLYAGRDTTLHQIDVFVLVDDIDFELLNAHKWYLMKIYHTDKKIFYARRYENGNAILMHRVVLGLTERKQKVDHADGNGLNNQRNNLRPCTTAQNNFNSPSRKKSKSIYKGVQFPRPEHRMNYFRSEITINGKKMNVGKFKTEEEAALAYNKKAVLLHGEFAKLNIIGYGNS